MRTYLLAATCAAVALLTAGSSHAKKNLIIDTDLFSDVDDAAAILLAATSSKANLLAVNVNYPSSYSALAASAILAYYGHAETPVGITRPLRDETFRDTWFYELGEYASKTAYHWSGGTLPWGHADDAWDPVELYRKVLASAEDGSVTIASTGFFDNLSGLLNSTSDAYSPLSGPELIIAKVAELAVMGGGYPTGREYNFWGGNASLAAHVVHTWPGSVVFCGSELGKQVKSGGPLMSSGPARDPVRAGYIWYTYNNTRESWDPLTVLYAIDGLGVLFEYGNEYGYNRVLEDGSNEWVFDESKTDQRWLQLRVGNDTAAAVLDGLYLKGARMFANESMPLL